MEPESLSQPISVFWLVIANVLSIFTDETLIISSLSKPYYGAYIGVQSETFAGENQLLSFISRMFRK
jgi:hypothetical protein